MTALRPSLSSVLVAHAEGVRALAVALVDEGNARHAVATHLTVHSHRLRLDPSHTAEDEDGAIEHAKGTLHLDGEVHVTRGVDDVDLVIIPGAVGGGRLDGDAALTLQLHRVHLGTDAVLSAHLVDGVDAVGVEENPLGQGSLSGVNVGADSDVAYSLEIAEHGNLSSWPGEGWVES